MNIVRNSLVLLIKILLILYYNFSQVRCIVTLAHHGAIKLISYTNNLCDLIPKFLSKVTWGRKKGKIEDMI